MVWFDCVQRSSVLGTELENTTVSDQNNHRGDQTVGAQMGDDNDPALEEPVIDGDAPQSIRDWVRDSRPGSNTVDDGFLATDPEDEAVPGEGWTS
ncbi:hypothetical protein CH302_23485 [Rhodococcus sp. 15-2388-1-1a]|nr:hypothetical protein CH302_23485 [Rhodococcus sp. 15-2388-1-1a]OZF34291.1 hypothetical protein CH295_10625 [Rhodococcus sp. 14-2483-1-2]